MQQGWRLQTLPSFCLQSKATEHASMSRGLVAGSADVAAGNYSLSSSHRHLVSLVCVCAAHEADAAAACLLPIAQMLHCVAVDAAAVIHQLAV